MFKIEKGVPFTGTKWGILDEMEVGDSFPLPYEEGSRCASIIGSRKYFSDKKFSVRRNGDGYRCWRLA